MTRKFATLMSAFALLVVAGGNGSMAKGPMTGGFEIELVCHFPAFPSPAGSVACSGNASGSLSGIADNDNPYTATCVTLSGICHADTKKVVYNHVCDVGGEPIIENMTGSVMVDAGLFWFDSTAVLGQFAHLWIPFNWLRVGGTARVLAGKLSNKGNTTLTNKVNGRTAQDATGSWGDGRWVPLGVPGNCSNPTPLTVLITLSLPHAA